METRRWTNPSQPQTLQMAVWLLYLNAAFGLLLGQYTPYRLVATGSPIGYPPSASLVVLASFIGMAVAAFGIANEKRWGYRAGRGTDQRRGRSCCSSTSATWPTCCRPATSSRCSSSAPGPPCCCTP